MYLAYLDESGDSGSHPPSPTRFYVVSCVLIDEAQWLRALDLFVALRRRLKTRFGIRVIPEIKATDIRKGRGPLAHLNWSHAERGDFLRRLMSMPKGLHMSIFAVAIDKPALEQKHPGRDVRAVAWQYTLQRVDSFCREKEQRVMLFPDVGHGFFIQRMVRRLRRHQVIPGAYGGLLSVKAERIVEDPNDRQSEHSYFIQLADWAAYAAHRSEYVDANHPEFAGAWNCIGDARHADVNKLKARLGPVAPGIVIYP